MVSVQWSPRVADFVQEWEHRGRLAEEAPIKDLAYTALASSSVLGHIEQGAFYVPQALTGLYQVSGLLPALGDILLVEALELRVDARRITVSHSGLTRQVTIAYALGIERYRYEASPNLGGMQPLSSSFFV
ncbi:hypothetical protein GCM10028822_34310 [Hymenobacter terrigena]